MNDQPGGAPQPHPEHNTSTHVPQHAQPTAAPEHSGGADYSSNPLATFREGLSNLWKNSRNALFGIAALQVAVAVGAGIIAVLIFFTVIASALGVTADASSLSNSAMLGSALSQASGTILVTLVIVAVLAMGVLTFVNAMGLSLAGTAVLEHRTATVGEITKNAFKRTLPLLAQWLLIVGVIAALLFVPFLFAGNSFANPTSPSAAAALVWVGLYYLALFVVAVIVFLKLAFAAQAVVSLGMGPIQAIKYSWTLTKKRMAEVAGVLGVTATLSAIIGFIFELLLQGASAANAGLLMIIVFVSVLAQILLAIVSTAALAQRLDQFRKAGTDHKVNYLANVGAFVVAIVVSIATSMALGPSTAPTYENPFTDTPSETQTTESLQEELDQLYQQSQDMYDSSLYDYEYDYNLDSGDTTIDDGTRVN